VARRDRPGTGRDLSEEVGEVVRRAESRRLVTLALLSALLGAAGGLVGVAFLRAIALALNLVLRHEVAWELPRLATVSPGPSLVVAAVLGGLVVAGLRAWEPRIRGHGIPEAMEAVLASQSRIRPRAAIAKPLATAVAIGTGAPFGAEGPIVVTGGAIGSLLGQVVSVTPSERKILLASGAAAGMSAVFGTPIAAVLLAIELLLFEFSTRALVPLVVASVVADEIHTALIGQGPLFAVPVQPIDGAATLWRYVVLGLAAGLLALVVVEVVYALEDLFQRMPWPRWADPAVGAVGFALVGLAVPRSLGVGYDVIGDILQGRLTAGLLAAVLVAKLVAWWIAMGSGTSGSSLAPLLLIGAAFGGLVGTLLTGGAPSTVTFALVGMAATFGAAAGAPFTAIVLVFEMTRDFAVVLPLMLATVAAHVAFRSLRTENLMSEKLTRRGLHVVTDYRADVLRSTAVEEVMTRDVVSLPASATLAQARALFDRGDHHGYPLVDDEGRCRGMVTAEGTLGLDLPDDTPVADVAASDVVAVRPEDDLLVAFRLMADEELTMVPVVDDGQVVGVCSRTDILHARERELRAERVQRGWLSSTRHT
jgi:CIC family chloride channel protein